MSNIQARVMSVSIVSFYSAVLQSIEMYSRFAFCMKHLKYVAQLHKAQSSTISISDVPSASYNFKNRA